MYAPSEIDNIKKLAGFLRCEVNQIECLANKTLPGDGVDGVTVSISSKYLNEISLPKRRGTNKYRTVYSVLPLFASNALKVIKFYLNDLYIPNNCVHGFVKKRNIVTNARCHLNKKLIINIDIKDFFESINIGMVNAVYLKLGFNDNISHILSCITTLNDKLVAGFSTSPVIANLYCADMDNEISNICSKQCIVYTRYADDITLSGENVDVIFKVKEILQKYGFEINTSKTRYYYKGNGRYVTGLSVEDSIKPRIPKYIKKRLRAEVYCICKYGLKSHVARILNKKEESVSDVMLKQRAAKVIGWLSFISGIEYEFAEACLNSLRQIDDPHDNYYIWNAIKHVEGEIDNRSLSMGH